MPITVFAPYTPDDLQLGSDGQVEVSKGDRELDGLDTFNHPRKRRALILHALAAKGRQAVGGDVFQKDLEVSFKSVQSADDLDIEDEYQEIHSKELLEFLLTAWSRWVALGEDGREPDAFLNQPLTTILFIPPLVPINVPLHRDPYQRPSSNVMGQVGYYCTDLCTPIFGSLVEELKMDTSIIQQAVRTSFTTQSVVYALPTHPGHHAARDSFGGYCFLNQSAYAARLFQALRGDGDGRGRVAVLDVDYHCGNGTASIFYEDPSVFVVSIHCDPNFDYPFHSGFIDQTGIGEGMGKTKHIPLPPNTTYDEQYSRALDEAVEAIKIFQPIAVIVSLGLDTHKGDPCTIRRAGFSLEGDDYTRMGTQIGSTFQGLPLVVIQEGGYRMDAIGDAAANFVAGVALGFDSS